MKPAVPQGTDIKALVSDAAHFQLDSFHHTTWALRYRVHRVDSKEDSVRELVESSDGNVARTLARHGHPLTAQEDAAERERLQSLTIADLHKHHRSAEDTDKFGIELITALPEAMLFTPAPTQPQLTDLARTQIVLDYVPNPQYRPATKAQSLLAGIAGRVWIDTETHHLSRIEINVVKNLDLAAGILARVYPGGTLVYEQHPVAAGHDLYTHIDINVRLRELMVRTVPYHSTLDAADAVLLPSVPNYKQAVELLLSTPTAQMH